MKKLKNIKIIIGVLIAAAVLTGCGANASKATIDTANKPSEQKTVVIGIGNDFKPYCYLNDEGQLAGYDYELLKAINEKLPQYKFEYNQLEFKNILLSVQTGKVDVGAYQVNWNPEREKLFLFSDVPTNSYDLKLTVKKGRTDINSIEDLKGKNVFAPSGTSSAYILDNYNKDHGNPFNLILASPGDISIVINNISNGTWDTFIGIEKDVEDYNKQFGDKLQIVGSTISPANAYHIFNKDDTQIKTDFENALKELKDEGTLAKISIDILGSDYTNPSEGVK